jgi:hypothetical protein
MKAIARLVLTNFTATPLLSAFALIGFVMFAITFWALQTLPHSAPLLWFAGLADILLVAATSPMPLMFGRLAQSAD